MDEETAAAVNGAVQGAIGQFPVVWAQHRVVLTVCRLMQIRYPVFLMQVGQVQAPADAISAQSNAAGSVSQLQDGLNQISAGLDELENGDTKNSEAGFP